MRAEEPFRFTAVPPAEEGDFSSHSLDPSAVLALASTLFGAAPEAYVLGISGVEFGEVKEGLSAAAEENLSEAEAFFLEWLKGFSATTDARGYAHA